MQVNDLLVHDILRRCMVARIATLSHNGRPSVTSLYFISMKEHIWLGTSSWTLAARSASGDPRVSVLFEVERNPREQRLLRVSGNATVRTDLETMHIYHRQIARKYVLTPGGLLHYLAHMKRLPLMRLYGAQSDVKGRACVIDVTPEQVELIQSTTPG